MESIKRAISRTDRRTHSRGLAVAVYHARVMFTLDAKAGAVLWQSAVAGVGEVWQTVRKLKDYGNVARHLLARMFFNDGMVGVLIFGGITSGVRLGFL